MLQEDIAAMGAVRVRDVDAAQSAIVATAKELAEANEVRPCRPRCRRRDGLLDMAGTAALVERFRFDRSFDVLAGGMASTNPPPAANAAAAAASGDHPPGRRAGARRRLCPWPGRGGDCRRGAPLRDEAPADARCYQRGIRTLIADRTAAAEAAAVDAVLVAAAMECAS